MNKILMMLSVVAVCPDGNEFGSTDEVNTFTCSKTKNGLGDEKNNFKLAVIKTHKSSEEMHNLTNG